MTIIDPSCTRAAEVVLPCANLATTLAFYVERLRFRLEAIYPADAPRVAVVSGGGTRIRLERHDGETPVSLRLSCSNVELRRGADPLISPDGTRIELAPADSKLELPPLVPSLVVRQAAGCEWSRGRAGMLYRDLIPGRQGGRHIASHVRIPQGGPVPDSVHHHRVRFQMIYCHRGWVRVVYEDQGPPFVMQAGDCVLQPPHIRHRVLECSDALEVIEVASPAEHWTLVDHALELPTSAVRADRDFGGQRFAFHRAAPVGWSPAPISGFEARDTGIGAATHGLASALVLRPSGSSRPPIVRHDAELFFGFLLRGSATLRCPGDRRWVLAPDDAFVVPADTPFTLAGCSSDLEVLHVALPGQPAITTHTATDPALAAD